MSIAAIFVVELLALYFLSQKLIQKLGRFFYSVTKSEFWSVWLMAVVFLPGTFIHEVSHLITALILFVPVGEIEFMPVYKNGRVKLGSIEIGKVDPVRNFLVGVAPLVFGLAIISACLYFFIANSLYNNWKAIAILVYIVFEVGSTMFLSREDLKLI